ncbi:MAG TPA: hypothetical protein VGO90_10105 [Chthoniobacteraceae bacterium]|nr:hypothetical protein [Chthoniobacteraceae bacterium]
MKPRLSLLQKVWRKLRGDRVEARRKPAARKRREIVSALEPLEGRIAPAALINPTTLVYKDFDGDVVTVKFSKPLFTQENAEINLVKANDVFKFKDGSMVTSAPFDPATAPAQQLSLIDLTKVPTNLKGSLANGTGMTITAVQGSLTVEGVSVLGDGFADIGYLKATGLNLGKVSISGDLGQIDAGKPSAAVGVTALIVKSMGMRGVDTQIAAGASLDSTIIGALGALTVKDDLKGATLHAVHGTDFLGNVTTLGRIGNITIGGSLLGRVALEAASDSTGFIESASNIGVVKIGTDAADGIFGGGGVNAGSIVAAGKITSVTVSGDIAGGGGANSGAVRALTLGPVIVKGDLAGGAGSGSGSVGGTTVGAVTIGDDVVAGAGIASGVIFSTGTMGAVKINGDIDGTTATAGTGAGGIEAGGKLTSVSVLGTLKGGAITQSGFIDAQADVGALVIHDILGGAGDNSGSVAAAGKVASLAIAGNVIGGTGFGSGSVFTGVDTQLVGDLGAVKIGGRIQGGTQDNTGVISSGGKIASVTIGPAAAVDQVLLQGGAGDFSGAIFSRGAMGAVKIAGHVQGGAGDFSGSVSSRDFITPDLERAGDMGAVIVKGNVSGGSGDDSGQILADGKLASATIGNLAGSGGDRSGSIRAGQGFTAGAIGAVKLGTLTGAAGGDSGAIVAEGRIASVIVAGNTLGGSIRAGDDLGAITFSLNVDGTDVSARGKLTPSATADLAIGKITIGGNVSNAQFLAGYGTDGFAVNGDAQIGAVMVKGNWTGSDIVAGVVNGGSPGFGTEGDTRIDSEDNAKIVSQIASIVITGNVLGTGADGDHFGFTAQKIGSFKIGTLAKPLNALADGQVFEIEGTTDVSVREVSPLVA